VIEELFWQYLESCDILDLIIMDMVTRFSKNKDLSIFKVNFYLNLCNLDVDYFRFALVMF
jgi:hypothetical protein